MVNLRHSCPITQSEGAKTFVTEVYSLMVSKEIDPCKDTKPGNLFPWRVGLNSEKEPHR